MTEDLRLDAITRKIIGAAINVHRALGPGLLESAYETCLAFELQQLGLKLERQKPLPVRYRGITLDCGYRLDLVVEDCVIVEVKATEGLLPVHQAQVMSYLRLSGLRVGLLITFNVPVLKRGLKRIVNDFPESARAAAGGRASE
jgi:GxxExxY protein